MEASRGICWNAYPALIASGCFGAGICLAEWSALPVWAWASVAGAAVSVAIGSARPHSDRIIGSRAFMLTGAAFGLLMVAGAVRHITYTTPAANHIAHVGYGREVEVAGWIADSPVRSGRSLRFVLQIGGVPFSGKVLVSVRNPSRDYHTCDVVRVRGELAELPRRRNPGDFDYGAYLRRKQILVRMFADEAGVISSRRTGIACFAADARLAIANRIDRYVVGRQARGVLRALLLGDRRGIDRAVRDRFARTGLLHVLAVSGLHVMVVGMILYRLLGPTLMRLGCGWRTVELVRTLTTAALLLAYMVLAGGTASVVRAVVMAQLFMLATALQRGSDSFNTLGMAALVILAVRPAHLFEPGFQLSMAAVGAIIGLMPQLERWFAAPRAKAARYVHASMVVTTAATLGTLPVVLYHFGQAALGGFLLNLPAIPITTAVLVSGIAAIAAGELTTSVGLTLGASSDLLARSLLAVSEVGDEYIGWSLLEWSVDHPAPILSMVLIVIAIGRWRHPSHRWVLLLAAGVVLTAYLGFTVVDRRWSPDLEILFLDVGQGDAAIVRLPNDEAMLIDAGPRTAYSDAGEDIVVPQLERLGIRRVHTAVITHPDSDHLGGLPAVLRALPVGRVVRSGFEHPTELFAETGRLLDSLNIPQVTARSGDTLLVDPDVRIYVLAPTSSTSGRSPNDHSIVLRLAYGTTSVMMTGDAPADAELAMVRTYGPWLRSNALKVGHHGSRTSSVPAFLSGVRASGSSIAVVSVAQRNRYGLPDEDVLDRLLHTGFDVQLTSTSGAVWVRSDGDKIEQVPY